MTGSRKPGFSDLSKKEVEEMLRRNNVGRLAYSSRGFVDIRPVHYVWRRGWLFGRTSDGDKLVTLRHNQWVAFEIDEISGPLDWKSVIVRGSFYRLSPEGNVHDVRLYKRARRAIREVAPDTFTSNDPVPFRSAIFGIAIDSATGRASSTAGTA